MPVHHLTKDFFAFFILAIAGNPVLTKDPN